MKVKELIEVLSQLNPELMVAGYEGGVNEVDKSELSDIELNVNDFSNLNNYYNFKRKITQAQKALNEASLYLTENEKNEWRIQIDDVKYQLDRFVFED